jgi:DNA-binding transcriptional LysR family regulator
MPPLQRRLAKDTPFMSYHVEPMGGETFARVESGDLDFLISVESCEFGSRHGAARDLKMRSLHTDDFVCLVDENHSTIGDALTLEDYKALPHISVSFGQNLNTLVEQAWKRANLDIDIVATVPSFSSTLFVLPGTEMIATVQRRLAQVLAAPLGLKILECPVEVKPLQQILMWHPRNDADPGHQYLRQMFVDAAGVAPHKRAPKFRQNAIQTLQQRERGFEQIPAK